MVRQSMPRALSGRRLQQGLRVYTTLSKAHQDATYDAVRRGVLNDRRHSCRGAEAYVDLPPRRVEDALEDALQDQIDSHDIYPALVLAATPKTRESLREVARSTPSSPARP